MARRLFHTAGVALLAVALVPGLPAQTPADAPPIVPAEDASPPQPKAIDTPPQVVESAPAAKAKKGGLGAVLGAFGKGRSGSARKDESEAAPADPPPADPEVQQVQAPPALDGQQLPGAQARPGASPSATPPPGAPYVASPERYPMGVHAVGVSVEVQAPAAANLHQPTPFKIVVRNTGAGEALGVVVRDALPEGLQFVSAKPEPHSSQPVLVWNFERLAAGAEKVITITAVPTKPDPIEHAASVEVRGGSRARTMVKAPQLKVEQRVDDVKVLKGRQVQFNIVVTNHGTGPARDVMVRAKLSKGLRHERKSPELELPLKTIHGNGTIAAGESVPLDLVVDTVEGGEQDCTVEVTSPDVPRPTEESKHVLKVAVVEPKLKLEFVRAPRLRVTNALATYTLKVENTGTEVARKVRVAVWLPSGVRLEDEGGAKYVPDKRILVWEFPQLDVNESHEVTFNVQVGGPQLCQFAAMADANGIPRQDKSFATQVEGIAHVDLEIVERKLGLDVGEETDYVIRLENLGSKDARNLIVGATLSDHLAHIETDGTDEQAGFDPTTKTVKFPPIAQLAARGKLELIVRVKAQKPGQAEFRVTIMHEELGDGAKLSHVMYTRVHAPADGGD